MKSHRRFLIFVTCIPLIFMIVRCGSNNAGKGTGGALSDSCTFVVQAEDFLASSTETPLKYHSDNTSFVKTSKGGWLSYSIDVPYDGRYQAKLFAQTKDSLIVNCWVEDYLDELSWPYCGAYYFKLGNQPTGITEVENMNNSFHDYTLEWLASGMTVYIDGIKYFEYNDTSNDFTWPFNKPENLILNLAIGGGWGGAQGLDPTMTSEQFIIDYVRVYEKR